MLLYTVVDKKMLNKLKYNIEKKNSDILNVVQIKPGVSV